MTVQRLLMPLVLIALVFLTGCSTITARDALTGYNLAKNASAITSDGVREEVKWRIRSIYGQ